MASKITVKLTDASGYASALEVIKPKLAAPLHFLNAPFYGEWQAASGKKVVYFTLASADKILGCGLAIAYTVPGGYYYLYCPYGPLVADWPAASASALAEFFKSEFDAKLLFARLDASEKFKPASASVSATSALQPRNEWLLDITASENELLANMHKKCRYHIGLAERKGASFRAEKCSDEQLEIFYKMLKITASRDKFGILTRRDYQAAFETLAKAKAGYVAYADIDGRPAAAALIVNYDGISHYVYGASTDEFRKIAPGYYLQWQCILKAKASGDKLYNFGGISGGIKGDQLASVTVFKQRFGGFSESHPLPADIAVNSIGYKLFELYKLVKR